MTAAHNVLLVNVQGMRNIDVDRWLTCLGSRQQLLLSSLSFASHTRLRYVHHIYRSRKSATSNAVKLQSYNNRDTCDAEHACWYVWFIGITSSSVIACFVQFTKLNVPMCVSSSDNAFPSRGNSNRCSGDTLTS